MNKFKQQLLLSFFMVFPFSADFYPHYLKIYLLKKNKSNIKFFSLKKSKEVIFYFIKNGNIYDWQKLALHIKYNDEVLQFYIPILFKDFMANKSPNYNFYESIIDNAIIYSRKAETLLLIEQNLLNTYKKYKYFYIKCNFMSVIKNRDIYPKNANLILHKIKTKNI